MCGSQYEGESERDLALVACAACGSEWSSDSRVFSRMVRFRKAIAFSAHQRVKDDDDDALQLACNSHECHSCVRKVLVLARRRSVVVASVRAVRRKSAMHVLAPSVIVLLLSARTEFAVDAVGARIGVRLPRSMIVSRALSRARA